VADETTQATQPTQTTEAPPVKLPDMKNPITRAFMSLQKLLNDAANDASGASDTQYDALIAGMTPMIETPGVREAIAGFEVQRESARKNARSAAAARIRIEHAEVFAVLDTYGRPPAPMPTAANNRAARAPKTDETLTDLSGVQYVKRAESIVTNGQRTYVRTNAVPCGTCPISETVGKTFSAAGNLRQDAYRAIGRSTTEQMTGDAHASCFAAYRDAEADFDKPVTVTHFDRVA
jgi:hypothetical protein